MGKSLIGFHYSSGGNKTGIGDLITKLNTAGIPILLKGTDDAGLCFEGQTKGQTHGVKNHLIYRVSTAGQPDNIEYDVPDYTKSPLAAATEHFNKTAAKWPIELHRETVWMEPINEPRAKLNPGDVQWENMHPVDWLGEFMLEYAKIANGQGFRVCGPSFNSGEPEVFTINCYEMPGMLAYFEYCAANPDKAALSIHEYVWDRWQHGESWPNWYPSLWGRVEAAIAAADKHGIPRAFPIFVTEWGFAHNNAPRWPECEPHLTAYNEWAARWLLTNGENQIKGVAAWTLSDGWGDVDLDLQSWFEPLGDYAVGTDFPEGPQPAKTHIDFGGTTPGDIPMDTWQEDVWKLGEQNKVLGFVTGAALQVQITADGYQALSNEYGFTRPDGKELVCQRAKHAAEGTFRTYYCIRPDFNTVYVIEAAGGTPSPPPFEFKFYPVEGETLYVTSHFNAPRPQFPPTTNQKHEGVDLRAFIGKRLVSVADGVVDGIRTVDPGKGYGLYVRIKHTDRYLTWYGHMQSIAVSLGQQVAAGQFLGIADSTGEVYPAPTPTNPGAGSHLHLTLQDLEEGLDGYIIAKVVNPLPWLEKFTVPTPPPTYQYNGPAVTFSPALHAPGSDWEWAKQEVQSLYSQLQIPVKFMSDGASSNYYQQFTRPQFHLVRVFWKATAAKSPLQAWEQDIRDGVIAFYQKGARKFELLNEPNLEQEGAGLVWTADTLGEWLKGLADIIKANCPDAKLYFPGMSPGLPFSNQFWWTNKAWPIVKPLMSGFCLHTYTDIVNDQNAAVHDIVNQVKESQAYLNLQVPLVVSEASVNRAAPASYKAAVYRGIENELKTMPGIEAVCWYISSWAQVPPEQDGHQEDWIKWEIGNAYKSLS